MAQLWEANAHTVAKIGILGGYLDAWFAVMGRTAVGLNLIYIDGFSGPGKYLNEAVGSPIAALRAAEGAIAKAGDAWKARNVKCVFVDKDQEAIDSLRAETNNLNLNPRIQWDTHTGKFADVFSRPITKLLTSNPRSPVFAFLDPFGATGVPMEHIHRILSRDRGEVLVHCDDDGHERIIEALNLGFNQASARSLTIAFGNESWRTATLPGSMPDGDRSASVLELYRQRILEVANFAIPFRMLTAKTKIGQAGYHLIFSSNHDLGAEKMKEAMKRIDLDGTFSFSDAFPGQTRLILFDNVQIALNRIVTQFGGQTHVSYTDINRFVLADTLLVNAKKPLEMLEKSNRIAVTHLPKETSRRVGTYNTNKYQFWFDFPEGGNHGQEIGD